MADMTAPTGQAPTMAPSVCTNDQVLPRIRWVQTGYLKFSAKGTKREVFGMPIPGSLITADLREASYYQEYLANMVKHRWFLAGEPAKKPNPIAQKVRINILQYLIHLRMCKDVLTKMMKMFLLVENLRQQNLDNHEEKSENKRRVPTEMELELELTQQGSSYEVSKHLLLSDIEDNVMDPVTLKMEILLEPTSNKLSVGFNSLVHSIRALSTLRRSGLRTASTAAKPCQGDSLEFYLIIGSIYTDQRGTVVLATLFNESEQRRFRYFITNIKLQESRRLQLLTKESLFPNKGMKEEFPDSFGSLIRQRHVDNDKDPEVSTTSELFALACGPTWTPISITLADPDIMHFDNSSDLLLSTSLNELDNATLHIDGQSTEVDAPPDIIDVVDEEDDIIDDDDARPHDLADSDDEDLINIDDDGVDKMLHGPMAVTVAVRIVLLHTMYPPVEGIASLTEKITDKKGPVPIRFELRDKQTLMPLGDHAAHWSSNIGEVIRGVPLYYPYWLKVPKERKAALITDIGRQTPATQEYPSLIDTFFVAHTVNGVFTRDEDRLIYEEMRRLEATGTYTNDEINRLPRRGKQQGHILGVGRFSDAFSKFESAGTSGSGGSGGCGDDKESADDQEDEDGDGCIKKNYRLFSGDMSPGILQTKRQILMAIALTSQLIRKLYPGDIDMSPGNMCHGGTNYLTEKYVGPTVSLGIFAGERIPSEGSLPNIPQRQVARKRVVALSVEMILEVDSVAVTWLIKGGAYGMMALGIQKCGRMRQKSSKSFWRGYTYRMTQDVVLWVAVYVRRNVGASTDPELVFPAIVEYDVSLYKAA
nr:hypothetical protein [Tanacetum cinerariifolium]